MMNRIFLSLISIAFVFNLVAQKNSFEFVGTLKVEDLEAITYKLNFEILTDGQLSGSSTSDFSGANQTSSKILGKVDWDKKQISFHETLNIETKSEEDSSRFCYIQVQNLPLEIIGEQNLVRGNFEGHFPNGDFCAKGELNMIGGNLLAWKDSIDKIQEKKSMSTAVDTAKPAREKPILKEIDGPLQNGNILSIDWNSEKVRLDVWDAYEEDNDRVNIYLNGELKYQSLLVREAKRSFNFDLPKNGSLKITIEAETEGSNPPNTMNAQFIEKGQVKSIVTKLKKGEFVEILIQRHGAKD